MLPRVSDTMIVLMLPLEPPPIAGSPLSQVQSATLPFTDAEGTGENEIAAKACDATRSVAPSAAIIAKGTRRNGGAMPSVVRARERLDVRLAIRPSLP